MMTLLKWMMSSVLCMCFLWTSAQAADLSQQARQALKDGRISEATNLLHEQVTNHPRDYQAWFLLGVSQSKIQRYHPAIESFRRVIELRPDLAEPHNNLAVIYNELDDVPAAIRALEASLTKKPNYLVAEENIADLYLKMALRYYKKVLEKTDDQALQLRYSRLLKVRNPISLARGHASPSIADDPQLQISRPSVSHASRSSTSKTSNVMPSSTTGTKKIVLNDEVMLIKQALEIWRHAWESQDLPDYFDAYADDYKPSWKFKNQDAWEAYKMRVIGNKKFITVSLMNVNVILSSDQQHAKVRFDQVFHSDSYNGDDKKILLFKKTAGNWKITREKTL